MFRWQQITNTLVAATMLTLAAAPAANAANVEGQLDPTFGYNGGTSVAFDVGGSLADTANAVVVQPDHKIVVAGTVSLAGVRRTGIGLLRLMRNGAIDTSFGTAGKTVFQLPTDNLTANQVLLQPNGKILVAGAYRGTGGAAGSIVLRFDKDGLSPDTSFAGQGYLQNAGVSVTSDAKPMALATDGSIYIATSIAAASPAAGMDFNVRKLTASGAQTWDATFGFDAGGSHDDYAKAIAVLPSGQVLVAGTAYMDTGSEFGVARLNASDGQLDNTFATHGKTTINFELHTDADCFDDVRAMQIYRFASSDQTGTPDLIWIAGTHCAYTSTSRSEFVTLRDDGSHWFTPFDGKAINDAQPDYANQQVADFVLQRFVYPPPIISTETRPIFVSSGNSVPWNSNVDMLLNRTSIGMLDAMSDSRFGNAGFQSVYYNYLGPGEGDDYAHAATMVGAGYMLVVGSAQRASPSLENSDFAIVRLLVGDEIFHDEFDQDPSD